MIRRILLGAAVACLLAFAGLAAHADALDDILRSGRIRIATDVAIPPAGMVDARMRPTGSDVETGALLAQDWHLEPVLVPTTGPTRIPNLLTGKADIIISTLSVTQERARVIAFSRPYAILQSVVGGPKDLTLSNIDGLRGMAVAVTRGTTQDTELTRLAGAKGFTVTRYDDDATLVTAGATGQARLVATSVALVQAVAQKNPASGFVPKFVLDNFDLAIGVRKDEPRLLARLNEWVLANLNNGRLNDIYRKYYGADLPAAMRPPAVQ